MTRIAALALCAAALAFAWPRAASADTGSGAAGSAAAGSAAEVPTVIVLTFGEGDRIFERWGHAALCLDYPRSGAEPICFNWGVTDFDATGELVWGFLRGEQLFWVEPERMSIMIGFYEDEDRDIYEQKLALAPDAAARIDTAVTAALDGPWRFYVYDQFTYNCTTIIRDLLDDATRGALRDGADRPFGLTYREIGYRGLADSPVLRGMSDFFVGRSVDAMPTVWQAMFSPDVLRDQLAQKLDAPPTVIYKRRGDPYPITGTSGAWPMLLAALVFALPIAFSAWRRQGLVGRAPVAWATVWLGGLGLIIWSLAAISGIPGIRFNEVALIFVPFDLALPFMSRERRRRYARVRLVGLLAVAILHAVGVLAQPLWVPIASAFAMLLFM